MAEKDERTARYMRALWHVAEEISGERGSRCIVDALTEMHDALLACHLADDSARKMTEAKP